MDFDGFHGNVGQSRVSGPRFAKWLLDFDNQRALDGLWQTAKVLVHFRLMFHWSCAKNV
jgi:hypothetical protein